jgi:acyl-CoA reductase-like NAD-dependent aldehyde dehydrogenase
MTVETSLKVVPGQARSPRINEWLASLRPALLIDNAWVPAKSGKTFDTINPTTGRALASVAMGDAADVDDAVRCAQRAFEEGSWSRMGPGERSALLRRFASLMEEHLDELAELETLDNGLTVATSRGLIATGIEIMSYFAGAAQHVFGETVPTAPDRFHYVLREPVGVCGAITPWNGPIIMACLKIGPALAAGNTLVFKPAEQTPLTALRLGELALAAGFPPGVFNVVTGYGEQAGAAIAAHPGIAKVAFTGSTAVGKQILAASVGNLKQVSLELGGKSPNVVFADANLTAAVQSSLMAFTVSSGQVCVAGTRLFVQRDFKDEFLDSLVSYANTLTVGDPLDPATALGPLASQEQFDRVRSYLEAGHAEGAVALTGGSPEPGPGYFVRPTIFDGVERSMRIAREEIFGPVVSVISFNDADDAVLQGNDTEYGLAAAVWTNDLSRAHKVARGLKAGVVWVNQYMAFDPALPFGGYKQSGVGRECGAHWYEHYTEQKSVMMQL